MGDMQSVRAFAEYNLKPTMLEMKISANIMNEAYLKLSKTVQPFLYPRLTSRFFLSRREGKRICNALLLYDDVSQDK